VNLSLRGIDEANKILALSSFHKINLDFADKAGMALDDYDENKLTKKEITSEDEDIVRITEDGYAEAVGIGSTMLHATVEYDGIERTASLPVTVALEGDNLMEDLNPGFDNDTWIWDMARTDEAPETPWWIRAKLGAAPTEDDENNRALGVEFNPEVSVYELYGKDETTGKYNKPPSIAFARSATGPRIKVKSGQFYQFSFMVKLEDWQLPEGAYAPEFAFDIYPYPSKDGTKSIAGYNRTVSITKESEYVEKYSNGWVKVTLPVTAPFTPTEEDAYLTPVFVFRPNNVDYEKKGFGGTVWFDDFELREVGFDRVEITYEGTTDSGVKGNLTIAAQALAANGTPISISTDSVPRCIKFNSSDTYVLENPVNLTAAQKDTTAANYRAQGTAALGGKNGKTTISAEMTLHGITRYAEKEIEVKNFDIELLYAEAETADETVEVGENTQIITRGYLTDGNEADLSKALLVYKNETPDVISVDESGMVTALKAGVGSVRVTAVLNDVGVVTTVPVTVTDTSLPVEDSFVLTAPESVGFLRDAKLTVTGKMESGYDAQIDYGSVVWYGTSENGITVDEAGCAFGCKLGATADIYAELTINGKKVTTNTVTMTVSESDLRDYLLDFRNTDKTNAADLTLEEDGWIFSKLGPYTRPALSKTYVHTMDTGVGQSFSIKTKVPYAGVYNLVLSGRAYGDYASASTYLYVDGVYAGDYCFYNEGLTAMSAPKSLRTIELTAGEHELTFVAKKTSPKNKMQCHTQLVTLLFSARYELPDIKEISAKDITLGIGETKPSGAVLITDDGFSYEWQAPIENGVEPVAVSYSLKEGDAVTVDANGNVTGVSAGSAVVMVTATYNGQTVSKDINITVTETAAEEDPTLASVDIVYKSLVLSTNSSGLPLTAEAKNAAGFKLDVKDMTVVWESSDESVATVENGIVKPVSEGVADITVTITQDGNEPKTDTVTVSVRAGKTARTYYTDEKIANAQENVTKYSWAKDIKTAAEEAVKKYAALSMDELWSLIPGEGIPRTLEVGLKGDPDIYVCRYCGTDVKTTHGVYPWGADALSRPWKIQCQECKRLFPSNDFEKLYELGLDERGIYDADKARAENAKLVAESDGKINYLKNTLYPEVAENVKLTGNETVDGWGVDAGFGYDTGRKYSNGVREVHTYIPYYHHWAIWYSSAPYHSASVLSAIKSLSEAYIYTGDEKYGRLGAVMVDRLADVYPEFNLDQWIDASYSNGSTKNGKTVNNIWEAINGKIYARAYDAFFPMYDDPEVLKFLKSKSEQYEIGDKSNAEAIRSNIEENLLYELYEGATILDVHGNFGHHQSAVATAAVVLDTQPQTQTMIDWVFAHSESKTNYDNSGGGVNSRIINDVSRDGQGTESGAGYNRIWARELVDLANDLAGYDGYDGIDLWENTKYIQMFKVHAPLTMVERGTLPIGDTGSTAHYFPLPDMLDGILNAYQNSKENHPESAIELAQLYYQMIEETGSSLSDAHFDIFTKNPESVQNEIEEIIETHGEYDFNKSMILTGYGLAALKDGKLYDGGGNSGVRDTTRDFWIYFGGAKSHNHQDTLNLGMEAYGISMSPDNGYPEMTGHDPNRHQWVNTTLAHNAVVVNEKSSIKLSEPAKPLHFDAKDTRVKVMDVNQPNAYGVTDEYRRTVVMIDVDNEISYGVDFFKVHGGDDHLYSFHASSEVIDSYSDELDFYVQPSGTYAGIEAPFGNDPYTDQASSYTKLKYPDGYTWLYDVMRADNPGLSEFWVDYKIKDVANISRNPKSAMDIHLRLTMLNDFVLDEVTFAKGKPPRTKTNLRYMTHMNYLLARRKGKTLDTLFTTVLEPYNKTRYVKAISQVDITPLDDIRERDRAQAVKVELNDGRIDYIVYAQDNSVTYRITDADTGYSFDFRGFVGVWTVRKNAAGDGYDNVYNYINDGDIIGDAAYEAGAVCGEIADFTRKLEFDNFIEVKFDEPFKFSEDKLSDRMINVEYEGLGNAAYFIESATLSEDGLGAVLDIGSVTPIASYADNNNPNVGFNYDIAVGDRFEIALSHEDNKAPIFEETSDITTSAGSSVSVTVSAESPAESGNAITYVARTLPRGASFNPDTATFTWRPDDGQVGDNLVAIDAVDEYGRSSTTYFTVTVYGKTTGGSAEKNETPSTGNTDTPAGGGGGGGGGAAPDDKPNDETGDTDKTDETDNAGNSDTAPDASGETDTIRFTDLANCDWATDAINALAADGII
ncbi:MAG: heparinase II/III family protein, partial [Oscillospiraceae bacterium]|nr:heparinase II/III family protein [Oscillospiraceae bacterium]